MPVISERSIDQNLREIRFDKTPIMSTYLVAAVIGEYDYVEGKSKDGVLVRVYTPVGKKDQGMHCREPIHLFLVFVSVSPGHSKAISIYF